MHIQMMSSLVLLNPMHTHVRTATSGVGVSRVALVVLLACLLTLNANGRAVLPARKDCGLCCCPLPGSVAPARWHSMTVDVRMGTTCAGNLEMLFATRTSNRAPAAQSPETSVVVCQQHHVSVAGVWRARCCWVHPWGSFPHHHCCRRRVCALQVLRCAKHEHGMRARHAQPHDFAPAPSGSAIAPAPALHCRHERGGMQRKERGVGLELTPVSWSPCLTSSLTST